MDNLFKELERVLGANFTWSEAESTYTITYATSHSLILKMNIAEHWLFASPLNCASISMTSENLSMIFEKPIKDEKEAA